MKKAIASVLLTVMLFGFAGCSNKPEFKVDNEDNAISVYTCPSDNIFGLEKVVVFDNYATAVFDKDICDRKNHQPYIGDYVDEEEYHYGFYVHVDNYYTGTLVFESSEENRIYKSNIRIIDGRYVVTESFNDDEQRKKDPDKDFKIIGMDVSRQSILFNDGSFELTYTEVDSSGKEREVSQSFDAAKRKWGKEQKGEFEYHGTDIVKSYFLRLTSYEEEYTYKSDGVEYSLMSFDNDYIVIEIKNRSEETRTIGGEYKLQMSDNGVYRDLPMLDYDQYYSSYPKVSLYDVNSNWEETEIDPETYGDTFEIEPYQLINAHLLVLPYNIFPSSEYAGDYRLIYGDAVIDFSLELAFAW